MNSREAAFLALLYSLKGECFISEFLDEWFLKDQPFQQDYHLAHQIAYGSSQMALALDFLVLQVSKKKRVHLKVKERALLRTALFQLYFLDKIPIYAVLYETIEIAKKYFHRYFISYLNAILRKVSEVRIKLPQDHDKQSLSIRYSYPQDFVEELSKTFGLENTVKILESGNQPALVMARIRNEVEIPNNWILLSEETVKMAIIPRDEVMNVARSRDFFIQNITPAYLLGSLCKQIGNVPQRVLDMCASPGGKSVLIHDFFPSATLYANDVSPMKLQKLNENFQKYDIQAHVSCSEGEKLEFKEKFDLIILDVPCSNTGVLNKRPEARWRLNDDHYLQLEKIQFSLLEQSSKLLKPEGEIWYMTCSILPRENEMMASKACQNLHLKMKWSMGIVPNEQGWDGGFACSFSPVRARKSSLK